MQRWQLPEYIADILPSSARRLENFKEKLLSLFRVYGYELVNPPLMEYTESLLTRIDPGLATKTIRVADQISGKQLGFRADITPQIARIDAHLLSRTDGVNRLCYAGSTLHAQPSSLFSTREPLQIGAEIYGCDDLAADMESIDLMLKSMKLLGVDNMVLSLGHIQIFRILAEKANVNHEDRHTLLGLIQGKDIDEISSFLEEKNIEKQWINYILSLTTLYGGIEVLQKATETLPSIPEIQAALDELHTISQAFAYPVHIDLAELRMDHYHTGLLFGVYREGRSDALARGGRYNGLGEYFGRGRAATGFSFDLKTFLQILPEKESATGIVVNKNEVKNAQKMIDDLRNNGEIVIIDYINEGGQSLHCDRRLVCKNGNWIVEKEN